MTDIQKYNYLGNTNIGFYATVTEDSGIFPPEFNNKGDFKIENVAETHIARTKLVGLFTVGNKNCILIPNNTTKRERKKLEKNNINYEIIDSADTALGNLILCNDKGAIISKNLENQKNKISDALEVPVQTGSIAGIKNPGVCAAANNKGAVIHREASEDEAEQIKEALELKRLNIGTVNLGSPYIGSGVVANDELILTGENTSGPEIGRLDRNMAQD